ncbi:MAG TPA: glycoside hydrolase family 44 protein [Rhizomicrobium sp.]|jgi:hypothetical protein|nr:glycoside hydrolase family 44 protein [Rhizomicrobium sp.]
MGRSRTSIRFALGSTAVAALLLQAASAGAVTIAIDATAKVHPINPMIYGAAFASTKALTDLNLPLNRSGGNATSTYNWLTNASNRANDWYYESYPDPDAGKGKSADQFVNSTKQAGAQPILTVPLVGWVANLGNNRAILPSFSVAKYGAQCSTDFWFPDAGNGLKPDCSTPITGNDPADAYVPDSTAAEKKWIQHIVGKWGPSAGGGVNYYAMDNEASIWFSTHRDVHPVGPHGVEYRDKVIAMSAAIKAVDSNAKIMAPEEWGWSGYQLSGYDQQYAPQHGWSVFPDRDGPQSGLDYIPWLLKSWKKSGHPVDVVSIHFYPQSGEFGNDTSQSMQLLRNRSTRQLWDPNYTSESWIGDKVNLIPRLRNWVDTYYDKGTPIAITEYNWGAEKHINGATTLADVLGIFGREQLDMATYWTLPDAKTPAYNAIKMYRNYNGSGGAFGDSSISTSAPNPDNLSAFAALRTADGAMTAMVINKNLSSNASITLNLKHFTAAGTAKVYQLTAANKIKSIANVAWSGGKLTTTVPKQSITLFVLPKS